MPGLAWSLSLSAVLVVTLALRLLVAPDEFADFATYVEVAQDVAGSSIADLWPLEPLSRGMLLWSTELLGNAHTGTVALHWLNSIVFVIGLAVVTNRRKHEWQGLLFVWGLYGALLGFVTLRATPAYLLVAYAVLHLSDRPLRCAAVISLAAGFHASAVLMLAPWLCNLLFAPAREVVHENARWRVLWVALCIGCYLLTSGGIASSDFLVGLLSSSEATAKFATYAEFAAAGNSLQSPGHRAYFGGLCTLALMAALSRNQATRRIWPYVAAAFLLTALASASPVVSFRLSLFWTIPLLLSFPWARWTRTDLRMTAFAIAVMLLFGLGLRSALVSIDG